MKKKSGFIKVMAFLLVFVVAGLAPLSSAWAKTVYVDKTNPNPVPDGTQANPYKTIQTGITNAVAEDTVMVAPGEYNEAISISKNLSLMGAGPRLTRIKPLSAVNIVTISQNINLFLIRGFYIENGVTGIQSSGTGSTVTSITIENCVIVGNTRGIRIDAINCSASIINCVISNNNTNGIEIDDAGAAGGPSINIVNCIISNNAQYGLLMYDCTVDYSYCNHYGNPTEYYVGANVTLTRTNIRNYPPNFDASGEFTLLESSLCRNTGKPLVTHNDPDGTLNDMGAYGGPGAASFWPYPLGGPVITNLSVTPASVPQGGTITINATGEIR